MPLKSATKELGMKTNVLIIAITALLVTACGKTNLGSAPGLQSKTVSAAEQQGETDPNGGDTSGSVTQPAEPPPGTAPSYAQSMCKWAVLNPNMFVLVADGLKITGAVGNLLAKGHHVAEATSLTGNLIFLGIGAGAKIDHIGSATGNVIVCNADVGILDGGSVGNVVVVGGSVGQITDFTGNLAGVTF
jgi:hypothetical protein